MKLGKLLGAIVLKSFLFFFPQLLEFLSIATLKLCPRDRPPWLRSTLLNFKDPRALLCSGHICGHGAVCLPLPHPLEGPQARSEHTEVPALQLRQGPECPFHLHQLSCQQKASSRAEGTGSILHLTAESWLSHKASLWLICKVRTTNPLHRAVVRIPSWLTQSTWDKAWHLPSTQ